MTLTEAPPEPSPAPAEDVAAVPQGNWLTTADHKRVGMLYLAASLLFLLVGVGLGMALRAELAEPGTNLLDGEYARVYSLHGTLMPLLFLGPLWVGLATYLVPLQIGARRLALPRLQAATFWLYLAGGILLVVTYAVDVPIGAGLVDSVAIAGERPDAIDLWIAALALVALSSLLAAANLVVTIAKLRAPGLRLGQVPFFTWSVLAGSAVTLLTVPAFLAGLLLLYLDQHFGGVFFARETRGGAEVWQHLLWLYGRPDIYLLVVPALGAASDVVLTHARRPLAGGPAARIAIAAFAVLSLTAWAAGPGTRQAVVLPTFSWLTAVAAAPVGLLVLTWLGAFRPGARFHVSLLFVAAAVGLMGLGLLNVVVAAFQDLEAGTAWASGHLHLAVFGPPLVLALAALHHWAPKLWGRRLSTGMGLLELLLVAGGLLVMGMATYLLGYDGAPWRVADLGRDTAWTNLSRLSAAGGVMILLGVVLFVLDLLKAARTAPADPLPDDPYSDAPGYEWTTASPPPPQNFDTLPVPPAPGEVDVVA